MANRRAKGEGSLFLASDGRWTARMWANGRLRVKHGATKKECSDWLAQMRERSAAGLDVNSRKTLGWYLEHWMATAKVSLRQLTCAVRSAGA